MGKMFFLIIFVVAYSCVNKAMEKSEGSSRRAGSFRQHKARSMLDDAELGSNDSMETIGTHALLGLYFGSKNSYNPMFLEILEANIQNLKTTQPDVYKRVSRIVGKCRRKTKKTKFYANFFSLNNEEKELLAGVIGKSYHDCEEHLTTRFKKANRYSTVACGANIFLFIVNCTVIMSTLLPILITCYQ